MTGASSNGLLRVAVPNKGALSESAAHILSEAGYRRRTDPNNDKRQLALNEPFVLSGR